MQLFELLAEFESRFGPGRPQAVAAAPGRVNLIGEHTDYHEGFVLPAAIDRHVWAVGRLRSDQQVHLASASLQAEHRFSLPGAIAGSGGWQLRAEGVLRTVLARSQSPRGMDILLWADLPIDSGLSSSAASAAALALLAAHFARLTIDPWELSQTLRECEHRFAQVKCGIMDPMAVLLGRKGQALFLDCRSLVTRYVPIPEAWSLVLLDTGVRHQLASSEYNQRQRECAEVVELVRATRPQVRALRDITPTELEAASSACSPLAIRRCRHVLAENARVQAAVEAFSQADARRVGELFADSHQSLRLDYQVSCPELDSMVEAAQRSPGLIGARMTGGGFGGSTVNLVYRQHAAQFAAQALEHYRSATGREGAALLVSCSDGASVRELE